MGVGVVVVTWCGHKRLAQEKSIAQETDSLPTDERIVVRRLERDVVTCRRAARRWSERAALTRPIPERTSSGRGSRHSRSSGWSGKVVWVPEGRRCGIIHGYVSERTREGEGKEAKERRGRTTHRWLGGFALFLSFTGVATLLFAGPCGYGDFLLVN